MAPLPSLEEIIIFHINKLCEKSFHNEIINMKNSTLFFNTLTTGVAMGFNDERLKPIEHNTFHYAKPTPFNFMIGSPDEPAISVLEVDSIESVFKNKFIKIWIPYQYNNKQHPKKIVASKVNTRRKSIYMGGGLFNKETIHMPMEFTEHAAHVTKEINYEKLERDLKNQKDPFLKAIKDKVALNTIYINSMKKRC